jgi:formyl-CoA transferase
MGLFPTADGHINLSAFSDARFRALCAVIETPELEEDDRFATAAARGRNRPALNAAIGDALRRRRSADWLAALDAAGVPCGPVNDIPAVFADPQVQALGMATPAPDAERGEISLVAQPVEISGHERRIRRAAPAAGADTDAVLDALGLDEAARAALRRDGVI